MRVAALYDIHGNLPALEAVLDEVREAGVDRVVVGGDVLPGPWPRECLRLLRDIAVPVDYIHGNCERAILAQLESTDPDAVAYWGTTSGRPLPEPFRSRMVWTARQLEADEGRALHGWPRTLRMAIEPLGDVLFCHATPRSETELFTRLTDEARLRPQFDRLGVSLVVCGHTHMPFDRMVGATRVVNAGSIGAPFGHTGASWLLLG